MKKQQEKQNKLSATLLYYASFFYVSFRDKPREIV